MRNGSRGTAAPGTCPDATHGYFSTCSTSKLVPIRLLHARQILITAGLLPWHQANALRVLRTSFNTITPVLSLSHLLVECPDTSHEYLFKTLPLFKSLETLSLHHFTAHAVMRFPALHLEGLNQLRSLKLYRVLPSSIRLRGGCELHFTETGRLFS